MTTFTVPTTAEFLAALRFINLTRDNQKKMLVKKHYQNRSAGTDPEIGAAAVLNFSTMEHWRARSATRFPASRSTRTSRVATRGI